MQCLAKNDSLALTAIERGLSVEKCLSAPVLLNQKANEDNLLKAIYMIIFRFNNLVNVGKKMNDDQMVALTSDLFERFGGESLEDILLFFKMARQGEFGDLYRLDAIVVLSWIPKYLDLKIEAREREIQNTINTRKREENDAVKSHEIDEKTLVKLEELSNRITVIKERNTGKIEKDNPFFSLSAYIETLPEKAKAFSDEALQKMLDNTSKRSFPEIYKILVTEKHSRNDKN